MGNTERQCQQSLQFVLELIAELGFHVNYDKSSLTPSQVFKFLGMEFDLRKGVVRPTFERIGEILAGVRLLLSPRRVSAGSWLSLLGTLNATFAMVRLGRLRGRPIQAYLRTQWKQATGNMEDLIKSPPESWAVKFRWWLNSSRLRKGVSL